MLRRVAAELERPLAADAQRVKQNRRTLRGLFTQIKLSGYTRVTDWLGHESTETTQIYLHADMRLKERALAHANASGLAPTRYTPPDPLLAFFEGL